MESKKVCPKCGSKKIIYSNEVNTRSRGILFKLVSFFLAIFTCGLSLLITSNMRKVTTKNKVVGICQDCGHKWNI
jgi:ssDNA-binding Zn-finger/Zn-ribbon topoisomerase 1